MTAKQTKQLKHPKSTKHRGLKLSVTVEGDAPDDLILGLEEIAKKVKEGYTSGHDRNETGSYIFDVTGVEYHPEVRKAVTLPAREIETLNEYLGLSHAVEDAGRDEILHTLTVKFSEDCEADIKVVNSDSGPYVDAVLFEGGSEAAVLEPAFERIDGEFIFNVGGTRYVAAVKSAARAPAPASLARER